MHTGIVMLQQLKIKCFILSVSHLKGPSWRPPIPESVRNCLTAEVSASNPSFPVEMFITRLLKRCADHKQQCTAAGQSYYTEI